MEQAQKKEALRTWVFETDRNGYLYYSSRYQVSGPDLYLDASGVPSIPVGTILIRETRAPSGYLLNPECRVIHFTPDNNGVVQADLEVYRTENRVSDLSLSFQESVNRFGILLKKKDFSEESGYPLAPSGDLYGIRFAVVNRSTGAVQVNGKRYAPGAICMVISSDASGTVTTGERALPAGTYEVFELREDDAVSEAGVLTEGKSKHANADYLVNLETRYLVTCLSDGTMVTEDQDGVSIQFTDRLNLETTALDVETGTRFGNGGREIQLQDLVSCLHLSAGRTYVLKAYYMNPDTNEVYTDASGNPIQTEYTFTAEEGQEEVTVKFPAFSVDTGYDGVVTEYLYDVLSGALLAYHDDLESESQRFVITKLRTEAKDAETGDHISVSASEMHFTDTVSLSGLLPGNHYRLQGTLMDAERKTPITDEAGYPVCSQVLEFDAENTEEEKNIEFFWNGKDFRGTKTVAFEYLYLQDVLVGSHEDFEDENQTVYIPKIQTMLRDSVTGVDHCMKADTVTLTDEVTFTNLLADGAHTYRLESYLVDRKTGEILKDKAGEPVRGAIDPSSGTSTFCPDETCGTVSVTFEVPWELLAGKTVCATEYLYLSDADRDQPAAFEDDIENPDQDAYFPEIRTTLRDSDTCEHETLSDTEIRLTDTVVYSGLKPDTDYTLRGILMDAKTGQPARDDSGCEITAEVTFRTEKKEAGQLLVSGTQDVIFCFSGVTLSGKSLVAFEELYYEEALVSVHADLSDKEQTVKLREPEKPEEPKKPSEGIILGAASDVPWYVPALILTAGILPAAGILLFLKRKRK